MVRRKTTVVICFNEMAVRVRSAFIQQRTVAVGFGKAKAKAKAGTVVIGRSNFINGTASSS